jgi:hypothetical protein
MTHQDHVQSPLVLHQWRGEIERLLKYLMVRADGDDVGEAPQMSPVLDFLYDRAVGTDLFSGKGAQGLGRLPRIRG